MPVRFAVDTNCVIAAVCDWHSQHHVAAAEIERRLDRGEHMAVAVHALTEAYSVLTRFPAPHRLAPEDAWAVLNVSFVQAGTVVSLTMAQHIALLARIAGDGVVGGRAYDALIAECAFRARADALLTFNHRHFDPAPKGVAIVVPA
jgi:predicted nucleic acid-binding protein